MEAFPSANLTCPRARAWASLELDGQLSELEAALLAAHLASCASCAAAVEDMRALTDALRSAPAESPSRPLFVATGRSSRGRRSLAVRLVAAAAAVALAAGLGALAGSRNDRPAPPPPTSPDVAILPFEPPRDPGDLRRRDHAEPPPRRVGGL